MRIRNAISEVVQGDFFSARVGRLTDGDRSHIVSIRTTLFRESRLLAPWGLLLLLSLNSCGGAETACDSSSARTFVVKIISDNDSNALVNYAIKNSSSVAALMENANTEAQKLAVWDNARQGAIYRLDDTIRTNSRDWKTGATSCSGLLSVTVGDTTAQKQVDFNVEPARDGEISVSVTPFLF
jgi:hypothetical protein